MNDTTLAIRFLGTGNALSLTRQHTSIAVGSRGAWSLVDAGDGMGTARAIVRAGIPFPSITDMFLTHRHSDHIAGVPHVILMILVKSARSNIRIHGPKETMVRVARLSMLMHDLSRAQKKRVVFLPMKPGEAVRAGGGVKVTAAKVAGRERGSIPVTFAYRFSAGNRSVSFTGDMQPNEPFRRLASGSTVLVHECFHTHAHAEKAHIFGHSTAREAGEAACEAGAKTLILTHLPDESVVPVSLLEREARSVFRGSVRAAFDGMEWEA